MIYINFGQNIPLSASPDARTIGVSAVAERQSYACAGGDADKSARCSVSEQETT